MSGRATLARHLGGCRWEGIAVEPYKPEGESFRDVTRQVLFGADAVIFVSFGSRFSQSEDACRRTAEALRGPLGGCLPALPVPAGGIELESAAKVVEFYGRDAMLLVGGSLQLEPGALLERSRRFVESVREAAAELP